MNLSFWLRKSKQNKQGECPIYATLTVNGQSVDFSTNLKSKTNDWHEIKRRSKKDGFVNARLDDLAHRFSLIRSKCEFEHITVTIEQVRSYIVDAKGIEPVTYKLLETFKEYLDRMKGYDGSNLEVTKDTQRIWNDRRNNVQRYLNESLNVSDIDLTEIKSGFGTDLEYYLISNRKLTIEYSCRVVEAVRSVLSYAVDKEYISTNPLFYYKGKDSKPKQKAHLSLTEIEQLKAFDFSEMDYLDNARDIFLFLCYTGLLYSDFKLLEQVRITQEKDRFWIEGIRKKGQKKGFGDFLIPLHNEAITIIQKYGSVDNMDKISLEKLNLYLKSIAMNCKIKIKLSTRIGRNTFAHHALNTWNIPAESVARMLGHSSIDTTLRYYTRVGKDKLNNDIGW